MSVCEHNQCQKCCNSECTDIKSMIRTRRKFSSSKCNKCLESKCNHDQEIVKKYHRILHQKILRNMLKMLHISFRFSELLF